MAMDLPRVTIPHPLQKQGAIARASGEATEASSKLLIQFTSPAGHGHCFALIPEPKGPATSIRPLCHFQR
eukprot:2329934-Amphidinium_carterae.1